MSCMRDDERMGNPGIVSDGRCKSVYDKCEQKTQRELLLLATMCIARSHRVVRILEGQNDP